MTALDSASTQYRPRYLNGYEQVGGQLVRRTTGDEVWEAVSADGRWTYTRTETPSTPWVVAYVPTGQDVMFASLPKARTWTAGDAAVPFLRRLALDVIDRKGADGTVLLFDPGTSGSVRAEARRRAAEAAAERLGRARRALALHDGLVLADHPDARCTGGTAGECGGFLTALVVDDRAAWVHADSCSECVHEPLAKRRDCRALHRHAPCGDPDPVLCDHPQCSTPAVGLVAGAGCARGEDACCGCCEHDE